MSVSDNEIYVNYANVGNVGQELADANIQIQNVINQLEDVIGPLTATWSGASEAEYTAVQARWNNDTADMNRLLTQYANTLDEMTTNYGNTDNNLASQWASIT